MPPPSKYGATRAKLIKVAEATSKPSSGTFVDAAAGPKKKGQTRRRPLRITDSVDDWFESVPASRPASRCPRGEDDAHAEHLPPVRPSPSPSPSKAAAAPSPTASVDRVRDMERRIRELHAEQARIIDAREARLMQLKDRDDLAGKRAFHVVRMHQQGIMPSPYERIDAQRQVLHEELLTQAQTMLLREAKRERVQWRCLQDRDA